MINENIQSVTWLFHARSAPKLNEIHDVHSHRAGIVHAFAKFALHSHRAGIVHAFAKFALKEELNKEFLFHLCAAAIISM